MFTTLYRANYIWQALKLFRDSNEEGFFPEWKKILYIGILLLEVNHRASKTIDLKKDNLVSFVFEYIRNCHRDF